MLLALVVPGFSPAHANAPLLGLQLGPYGHFNVTLAGKPWLSGGEVRVGAFCSSCSGANSLESAPPVTSTGRDAIGEYAETRYTWSGKAEAGTAIIETAFRYYADANGTIVFEQRFPEAVPLEAFRAHPSASEGAVTLFPGFARNDGGPSDRLACAAYHGVFPQLRGCTVPDYAESHQGGVPLVVYDPADKLLPMTIFAPLSTPKAQHMTTDKYTFGAGVKATAAQIPAGWAQTWMLSGSLGINEGFQAWGDRVLALSGKRRADPYRDATHATIGYWTDNGGYYHYSTGNGSHQARHGRHGRHVHTLASASHPDTHPHPYPTPIPTPIPHTRTHTHTHTHIHIHTLAIAVAVAPNPSPSPTAHAPRSNHHPRRQAPNGSYVYARSYEEVLPEVKASHDAAGVPFGHWQFDSWFYPKDGNVTAGGGGGGVTNWTAARASNMPTCRRADVPLPWLTTLASQELPLQRLGCATCSVPLARVEPRSRSGPSNAQ